MAEILDFNRKSSTETGPKAGKFEFSLHPNEQDVANGDPGEVVTAEGFLKFGPAFIAIVDGPEDTNTNFLFIIPTGLVKYVKRLGEEDHVAGTLSP